ncbi:hypothetical protein [Methanosarcina sp. UBA411]|uniref:hypothetical protein n=1 Tax=Methanosarcina sp. UBA411 TaxID=1915589 RepID=UPI0025EAC90C|nr:hypothetical protein [Methanosarcina sp. UBA411]
MSSKNQNGSNLSHFVKKYLPNRNIISQNLKIFLPAFPYIIILTGLLFVVYSVITPVPVNSTSVTDISTRVSTISTISAFFTVVLTGLYFVVNSKQLDVMSKQLNEMKNDRELQNQPLPWISNLNFYIEKPKLFYSPPVPIEKRHSVQATYWAEFEIKNVGSYPAVCVDVSSLVLVLKDKPNTTYDSCFAAIKEDSSDIVRKNDDRYLSFEGISERIDTLEEKEKCNVHFMFSHDEEGVLLRRLIDSRNVHYPILKIRILFKNILGAPFFLYNVYSLYPPYINSEISPVLKDWLSKIVSFPITYNNELDSLKSLDKSRNGKDRYELFQEVTEKFNVSLLNASPEADKEKLRVVPIPGYFVIKPISEEEYKEATKEIYYGFVPF